MTGAEGAPPLSFDPRQVSPAGAGLPGGAGRVAVEASHPAHFLLRALALVLGQFHSPLCSGLVVLLSSKGVWVSCRLTQNEEGLREFSMSDLGIQKLFQCKFISEQPTQ